MTYCTPGGQPGGVALEALEEVQEFFWDDGF